MCVCYVVVDKPWTLSVCALISLSGLFGCCQIDWSWIWFKFHSNPTQDMWIDVNPTIFKQGLSGDVTTAVI